MKMCFHRQLFVCWFVSRIMQKKIYTTFHKLNGKVACCPWKKTIRVQWYSRSHYIELG